VELELELVVEVDSDVVVDVEERDVVLEDEVGTRRSIPEDVSCSPS